MESQGDSCVVVDLFYGSKTVACDVRDLGDDCWTRRPVAGGVKVVTD